MAAAVFPCAGVSRFPGALAGQLAQFVKQAGGSEVEHTVLGRQTGGTSPSPRGALRTQDAEMSCSQPALARDRRQDVWGWLSAVSPTGLAKMTLETPRKPMIKSTVRELFPVVIFLWAR